MADEGTTRTPSTPTTAPSSATEIEKAIEERRATLAATIDELSVRARPKEILRRGVAGVTSKAQGAVRTPEGELRTERVGAVTGALVVLAVALLWLRRRR